MLLSLFITFFKIGIMTFGGGYAMLPILEREVIDKKGWTDRDELSSFYAISQCTPGIIAVNVATFIGEKKKGILGGIISTLGVVTPSVIIITLFSTIIEKFKSVEWVLHMFNGIRACVCVLILNSVIKLFKSSCKDAFTITLFIITLLLSVLTSISPVFFALGGAITAILMGFISRRKKK